VAAGDKVFLQWTDWPDSHHGPVIDYLANCGSSGCETVDKASLEFVKIDGVGLVDDATVPGTWGTDQLIAQGSSWMVEIPPTIAPGYYVLRHELYVYHPCRLP
jgi:endoglucanase